ncbi:MAG: tripartite tricarboxylate transporter TctB family protein [Burkholderiales bacterium]
MKLNDAVWGALLLLFGLVVLVHVQSFPKIPGQQVGPALFPGIIAVGLGICGALLVMKGLATRRFGGERAEWFALSDWTRQRRYLLAFALTIGVNVFYILAVDRVGFILTGILYLATLFWAYGVPRRWIVPVAVVVTLGIHYAFYKLLKVPLPWGLLNRFAW